MNIPCPKCKNIQFISEEALEQANGIVSCETCKNLFDTTIHRDAKKSKFWGNGIVCLFLLLLFQIYYYESYTLSQNKTLRPWLKKMCTAIPSCQFPDYNNLDKFSVLKSSFEPTDGHYVFKTVFINQSSFSQKRPSIKLTLLDFTGRSFSERIFHPRDYSRMPNTLLGSYLSDETTLSIATPSNKIGGYRFELI